MKFLYLIVSLSVVAFAESAWITSLGPVAAFLGYALFWWATLDLSRIRRFFVASIWFALVQSVQLSWMTASDYMGPGIYIVWVGLILFLGIQFGLLTLLVKKTNSSFLNVLAGAGLWVLLEWSRLFLFSGFTWNPVGMALAATPFSLQWAALFGVYGLSFWVIFVNLLGLSAFLTHNRRAVALWLFCALLPHLYGICRYGAAEPAQKELSVLLVQTGLWPEERDFDPSRPNRFIPSINQWDRIVRLVSRSAMDKIDLIVFPEGAFPNDAYRFAYPLFQVEKIWKRQFGVNSLSSFSSSSRLSEAVDIQGDLFQFVSNAFFVQAISNYFHCHIIAGMEHRSGEERHRTNAAFCFSPYNSEIQRTEKQILVPIGEYLPLQNIHFLSNFLTQKFGVGDPFEVGKQVAILSGPVPIGVSICYEETYSSVIHSLKKKGAELFVNVSNDAWFPHSRLAKQHFDHGIIRAVENGISSIRACNTGVTGAVDYLGRVISTLAENDPGCLLVTIPINQVKTGYSIWGDTLILFLSLVFFLLGLKEWFVKEKSCPK